MCIRDRRGGCAARRVRRRFSGVQARSAKTGADLKRENALLKSFGYAAAGVRAASSERNFKVDCAAALIAVALCFIPVSYTHLDVYKRQR